MKQWHKERREKLNLQGKLTFERIRTQADWPKLKAKAACTRHLISYARHLCELHNDGSTHDRRRLACVKFVERFYEVCAMEEPWIPTDVQDELKEGVRGFMACYNALSHEALNADMRNWKMTPKFHLFVHLIEVQLPSWGNPRYFWTYGDEDLQRIMKSVALSCHPLNLEPMVLFKWLCIKFD